MDKVIYLCGNYNIMKYYLIMAIALAIFVCGSIFIPNLYAQFNSTHTEVQLTDVKSREATFNGNLTSEKPLFIEGYFNANNSSNEEFQYLALFTNSSMSIIGHIKPALGSVNVTGLGLNGGHLSLLLDESATVNSTNITDFEVTPNGSTVIAGITTITFGNGTAIEFKSPSFGEPNPGCKHCH